MQLEDALLELRYSKDWTPQTTEWYRKRLGAFIRWCQEQGVTTLEAIEPPLVRRYIDYLKTRPARRGEHLDSHTVHGHVRAIRALLFWAASEELIDERIPRRVKLPTKEQKVLKVFNEQQLDMLFKEAGNTPSPLRDIALLSILFDTGCRASEICSLTVTDVTFTPETAWLLVHGKGRKQREVALGKKARLALYRYIHRERKSDDPHVFIGRKGPLTAEGLDRLLYRLRDRVGAQNFPDISIGAHRWRHSGSIESLIGGMDLYALMRKLGHADIGTTTGYLKALTQQQVRAMTVSPLDNL